MTLTVAPVYGKTWGTTDRVGLRLCALSGMLYMAGFVFFHLFLDLVSRELAA